MDPRLSPNLTPKPQSVVPGVAHQLPQTPAATVSSSQPTHHNPTQPIPEQPPSTPAAHAPAAEQPSSVEQPMVPQVVAAFPVRQQEEMTTHSQTSAPAAMSAAPSPNPVAQSDDDLDKILQAVNDRVKAPDKPQESKKKELGKKLLSKTGKIKNKAKSPRPIGPMLVVLMVALMLSATAIFAYREGNRTATAASAAGKVGTSYTASSAIQEAGGSLVNPADLDDYAQTLQTKLDSLNDSQDFTTSSLSDQVLGL